MATVDELEPILLRIAAGARVIGAAWVGILVLVSYLLTRDAMVRPWLPILAAATLATWAIVSVGWTASRPERLLGMPALAVDTAFGVAVLVATAFTGLGALTYSGGFPLIVVAVASIRGRRPAWLAAAVMTVTTLVVRPSGVGDAVGSIVLYAAGAAIFTWVVRVLRSFERHRREADERRNAADQARIRAEERVEISRHLHDSVLQTLALIQRRPDVPGEVTVLARKQERDLREWLFGAGAPDGSLVAALNAAAGELEERYSVPIEVVTSGDCQLDRTISALVAATGEAITNAATHSGSDRVSVFVEVTDEVARVFVRDRGRGFDPEAVDADRMGVRESIVGRLRQHGGDARVRSQPDWGTEWRMEVPR